MLTDYHTHLRPDVHDTPPSRYFTQENVRRYLDVAHARGIEELGFSEHVYRFRESLDDLAPSRSGASAPWTRSTSTLTS